MSGRELSRRFYETTVRPLLGEHPHAAALLGDGSQVLGFDDDVSTDHGFGPGIQVFVRTPVEVQAVEALLAALPTTFEGYPLTHGVWPPPVEVTTAPRFFADHLGVDPVEPVSLRNWLLTPTQVLATLVDGVVFVDSEDLLTDRRVHLAWYPDDVWRYVLASAWLRISQEQAFVGRAGGAGDDLGSRVIAARLVREHVRLVFLIERRWAPYAKWLGTAFSRLPLATSIGADLRTALATDDWRERERAVCAVGSTLIRATNALGLAASTDPTAHQYFTRDTRVVDAEAAMRALIASLTDPGVLALVERLGRRGDGNVRLPGAIDQAVDSTEVLTNPARCQAAAELLGLGLTPEPC